MHFETRFFINRQTTDFQTGPPSTLPSLPITTPLSKHQAELEPDSRGAAEHFVLHFRAAAGLSPLSICSNQCLRKNFFSAVSS